MKEWEKGGQREDRDSKLGEQEGRRKKKIINSQGGNLKWSEGMWRGKRTKYSQCTQSRPGTTEPHHRKASWLASRGERICVLALD